MSHEFISLHDVFYFVRQYIVFISAFCVAGLLLSTFYVITSDPIYSARTQILIEPKIPRGLQQQQPAEVNLSLDTAQVESQLAVLRSQKIAMMVIDDLGLMNDPSFRDIHGPGIGARIRRAWASIVDAASLHDHGDYAALENFPWSDDKQTEVRQPESERERVAVEVFDEGLEVQRVGVSYAIDITFQSLEPALSARIANATADAFVREQVQTTTQAAGEGIVWLEKRMQEVGNQMNEATRIAQEFRAKHDYSIDQNQTPVGGQDGVAGGDRQTTLEQLEVTADTYRKMYESLLAAYTNSVDQQPYLIANARVITSATSPKVESWPRKKLILAFGGLAGLVAGIGFAVARRSLDRNVRSAQQIGRELGLACIGELPHVRFKRGGFGRLDEVLREPQSVFAASLKSAKLSINVARGPSQARIGITSVSPGDGKATVVSNLAALYAVSGIQTLVVNADNNSAVANDLLKTPNFDVFDQESVDAKGHVRKIQLIEETGYYCLKSSESGAGNLIIAKNLENVLKEVGLYYKMTLVDLPPFTSGSDTLSICPMLAGVIVVAQWGVTSMDQLAELVATLRNNNSTVLGVILTKVHSASTRDHRKLAAQAPR
ncbi:MULTISPECIES: GNVR domain-containing protein [unclassified Mesorhizobium]|uniref:GNVR domain-containing protein n=1 Tax=unclassified Mesorhizobium TaxID=325217 RepID=UPI0015E469B6|nr:MULTISPECIES: GNVR domain-containing protein [unclassified Mesorhizobium]